jgi:RNA polymerase sigma-70 factor (ECF subfamily)
LVTATEPDRLLEAAQAGDPLALQELLRVHRKTVFRYGLRFCRSTEDTEDAVQETLWVASRSIARFRRAAAITTWLFTIVRNKCHRLSRHRHDEPDLADVLPAGDRSVDELVADREVHRILSAALARLEPAHREVILLRDVEGLTAPEAASRLGVSVQALKSRLHRARAALRAEAGEISQ